MVVVFYGGSFIGGLEVFEGVFKDTLIYCALHIKRYIPLVLFSTNGENVFFIFFVNNSGYGQ
jgi:hypothetical protein